MPSSVTNLLLRRWQIPLSLMTLQLVVSNELVEKKNGAVQWAWKRVLLVLATIGGNRQGLLMKITRMLLNGLLGRGLHW